MNKTRTYLLFLILITSSFSMVAVADDDDDDEVSYSSDTWLELEIEDRQENAFGIEQDAETRFGNQDCMDNIAFNLQTTISDTALSFDGDLYLYIGEDCDDDDDIGVCTKIADSTLGTTNTTTFENIYFSDIFEDVDCADKETVYLWVAILEDEGIIDYTGDDTVVHAATLIFDGEGPSATVEIDAIYVGENNIEIDFESRDESAVEGYVAVYVQASDSACSDGMMQAGEVPTAAMVDGISVANSADDNSITLTGLDNGAFYQVAIATLDEYGNFSAISEPLCASPSESIGIGDALQTDGEYCFIATAAFGSYDHKTVRVLRTFRDKFLKHVPLGNLFIRTYYKVGPKLARYVAHNDVLRRHVQHSLGLFAQFSVVLVKVGPGRFTVAVAVIILLGLILGVLKRSKIAA